MAVLGASSYTYAEATSDEQLSNWIAAHVRALEFYNGVPALIVPDFVPGHKIQLLWRVALCGSGRAEPRRSGWMPRFVEHNHHSESSHFIRSAFCRHPSAGRHTAEESTGGRHAATAACFVRNVISA